MSTASAAWEDSLAQARQAARLRGIRWTRQREAIARAFFGRADHMAVEDLTELLNRAGDRASMATVYRTVNLLVSLGYAHKRHFRDGRAVFEPETGKPHHDHLVCLRCGSIVEFVDGGIEELQDRVARQHGFALFFHRQNLFGVCASCRAQDGSGLELADDRQVQ